MAAWLGTIAAGESSLARSLKELAAVLVIVGVAAAAAAVVEEEEEDGALLIALFCRSGVYIAQLENRQHTLGGR